MCFVVGESDDSLCDWSLAGERRKHASAKSPGAKRPLSVALRAAASAVQTHARAGRTGIPAATPYHVRAVTVTENVRFNELGLYFKPETAASDTASLTSRSDLCSISMPGVRIPGQTFNGGEPSQNCTF